MIAFGPVPSRRLGRSVGINNIPPKLCTYSCAYCQVGRTTERRVGRDAVYKPDEILQSVQDKAARATQVQEPIDYLTFVPDGEPTLDVNLGREIELLRSTGIKIAVITNASLIGREDVREDLMNADWVSLKVDSTQDRIWRRINRPHRTLQLGSILDGMLEFATAYRGELVTETMLVADVNDADEHIREVAEYLVRLKPGRAYVSIPTRPPAEKWARPPCEEGVNRAYQIVNEKLDQVEYLIGYEGNAFAFTGNVEEDLLSITAVHPMREEAVTEFLARAGAGWPLVRRLIARDELVEIGHEGRNFYMRRLNATYGR
jgi:wyosine [tRNA(Phe)-imidazoG37] synthetase (radical SAM superfamily)